MLTSNSTVKTMCIEMMSIIRIFSDCVSYVWLELSVSVTVIKGAKIRIMFNVRHPTIMLRQCIEMMDKKRYSVLRQVDPNIYPLTYAGAATFIYDGCLVPCLPECLVM